ncbi:MAG: hypothetical protein EA407_11195, partial [Rhodobacteraceae bacterium]
MGVKAMTTGRTVLILELAAAVTETTATHHTTAFSACAKLAQAFDTFRTFFREVVLLFRPDCSPVKVDQDFLSGCHSHGFSLVGMDLIRGRAIAFGSRRWWRPFQAIE